MSRTFAAVVVVMCALVMPARADQPRGTFVPIAQPVSPPSLVSHILYLNRCAGGCNVTQGNTDSRSHTSDIGHGRLSPFGDGDAAWGQIVSCVKQVMAPFNLTVTDVDPGNVDHFEVMVGGSPGELGLPRGVGGVADFPCQTPGSCPPGTYIQNALVFDFSAVWGGSVTFNCGTIAQEIAHAWALDHATSSSDPMTYNQYSTPLHYRDGAPCGSDCLYTCSGGGACNSFNVPCNGSGMAGTHVCMGTGQATQDELKILTALLGPAGAKAPTVAITAPSNGGTVQSGMAFTITATCDSPDGVQEVDLSVDGVLKATMTASPAMFTGPANLTDGTHHLTAACGTKLAASASATIDIIVGKKCASDGDCGMNGICYQMACIAGPNATGGLGSTCTTNDMCKSGSCSTDGTNHYCVLPCDPNNDQCPSGFGCLQAGMAGVCWLGASHGGGGCDAGGGPGGAVLIGLGFGVALVTRRRASASSNR